MYSECIEPEDALRILKEETPRRINRLRRELELLKEFVRERGQSTRGKATADRKGTPPEFSRRAQS